MYIISFFSFLSFVICGFLRCLWFFSIPSSSRVPASFLAGPVPAQCRPRFWPASWHIFASFSFFSCIQSWFPFLFLSYSFLFIHSGSAGFLLGRHWPAQFLPSAGPVSGRHPGISLPFLFFSFFYGFPWFFYVFLPSSSRLEIPGARNRKEKERKIMENNGKKEEGEERNPMTSYDHI